MSVCGCFGYPRGHPKSKSFVDRMMGFYYVDGKVSQDLWECRVSLLSLYVCLFICVVVVIVVGGCALR